MTAFYMFRQLFMVFHGECRADEHAKAHLHESPAVMTLPLIVLAIGSVFTGWLGAPEYLWGSRWDHWLSAVFGGAKGDRAWGAREAALLWLPLGVAPAGFNRTSYNTE